jgi:hypothetical protein
MFVVSVNHVLVRKLELLHDGGRLLAFSSRLLVQLEDGGSLNFSNACSTEKEPGR